MSRLPTTRLRAAGILTAITMTALLAACSSGSGDGAGDSSAADSVASSGSGGGSDSSGGTARELGDRSTAKDAGSRTGSAPGGGPTTPEMQRAVISSGAVSLSTDDVRATRQEVQRIVDAQSGDVAEENTESDERGDASYSRLVVRVPSAKFAATMQALEDTATLRSSTRGSEDVTTQVIDTGVRVRAQEASLERVELLLAEADSLKDVIWIESQLTSRQAELDSLKSQQSYLEDQTSLSTITVDISQVDVFEDDPEGQDDRPAGFLSGLDGGMKAMGAVLVAVLTILGALLPFAVAALVLGLPLWLVVRRRRAAAAPAEVADA
ncbi:protein of unknown function [Nocardioides exalbidus]|uniref:DUF4349 domain-containing protein n=1 Tax=Nocardioides exalbidus TaxID=402596 RepID=A0A1H4KI48_9ACTN|nr:DUF4349 domain-containing protein [Nocardioides exalbidus]SEB57795.1 protein of unknown function [Nocardioides exalbidus]